MRYAVREFMLHRGDLQDGVERGENPGEFILPEGWEPISAEVEPGLTIRVVAMKWVDPS